MLNTGINAGIRDVDYWTGGGLSGGKYDPYQLPMASEAVNRFAAEAREAISGTKPVDPKTMPKDVQKRAARERSLFGMIPTGAEDVAGLAAPAMKAMFLGLKKAGTPEEAADALKALDRLAKGDDPQDVWFQSKWAVDPIGKYPYTEISDLPMVFKPGVENRLNAGMGRGASCVTSSTTLNCSKPTPALAASMSILASASTAAHGTPARCRSRAPRPAFSGAAARQRNRIRTLNSCWRTKSSTSSSRPRAGLRAAT